MNINKIKEKIINMFSTSYKKEMEELLDEYKSCEVELESIFNKVISKDKINSYKLELFKQKLELLKNKINEILNNAQTKQIAEKVAVCRLTVTALLFIPMIIFLMETPIGFICSYLYFIFLVFIGVKTKNQVDSDRDNKELNEDNNTIFVLLSNCETHLNKHYEMTKSKRKESNSDLEDIDLADLIIQEYLKSGYLSDKIDPEIKSLVIKILQDDLKTDETDILSLLNTAKENLNNVTIEEKKEKKLT